jgi:GTPase SAR1 family protein
MKTAHNASLVLFFVGPPGVGKTSLVRAFMGHLDPTHQRRLVNKPKWTVAPGILCAAGHYTGATFDGGDTVGYNQAKETLAYWQSELVDSTPVTIFDGDRFSTRGSLEFVQESILVGNRPHKVRIVHLVASQTVLEARRAARGSNQNVAWMKSRVTKACNFANLLEDTLVIDTSAEGLGVDGAVSALFRGLDTAWNSRRCVYGV